MEILKIFIQSLLWPLQDVDLEFTVLKNNILDNKIKSKKCKQIKDRCVPLYVSPQNCACLGTGSIKNVPKTQAL